MYSHLAMFWLLTAAAAGADVLTLQSGESLSGRLIRVREGSLVFRTSLKGQLMTQMDQVATLSTEDNYVVTFKDETVRYGRFGTEGDATHLKPIDGAAAIPVELAAIHEAVPLPKTGTEASAEVLSPQWTVTSSLGVQARSGKSDAVQPYARIEAARQGESRLEGALALEGSDADDFPAWLRGSLLWSDFPETSWGPYASGEGARDTENTLESRTGLHLGVGRVLRRWGSAESGFLEGLAGLGLEYEAWEAADRRWPAWRYQQREQDTVLNAQLGLRYAQTLFGRGTLTAQVYLYPALTDWDQLRAAAETAVEVPFSERLSLRLHLLVGYEGEPALRDAERWNTAVGASVQVGF